MSYNNNLRRLLMVSASVCISSVAGQALAQGTEVSEVVVTASRADTTGFSAPTPTTVFSADAISKQGATNIADMINTNPAFKATSTAAGNGAKSAAPGANSPDLRGLGSERTLVLVNGMRIPPLAPATNVGTGNVADLNTIPSIMIQRMEVVTGGASAQWGSDAVSGVLNVIMNNNFSGLRVKASAGQSERGDAEKGYAGIMGGTDFAGGRGHITAAAEYERFAGLGDYTNRDYAREEWAALSNTAAARAAGGPAIIVVPHAVSSLAPGGLITGPSNFSLRNYTFNPDGSVRPYNVGSFTSGLFNVGGEGPPPYEGFQLMPRFTRATVYAHGEYELTDSITAAVDVSYAWSRGGQPGTVPRLTPLTVKRDNAYLPAAVAAAMDAQHITSITMNRFLDDIGNSNNIVRSKTPHVVLHLQGKLPGDWSWDANYGYGKNKYDQTISNTIINGTKIGQDGSVVYDNRRLFFAADAVVNPATGQIVCRGTLPGPGQIAAAAGCVPYNVFGYGNISPAARDWLTDTALNHSRYTQQHASLNIRGKPFSTWAGPVSIGAGLEYRKEKQTVTSNPLSAQAGYSFGNTTPFGGEFTVKEAYLDTITPLARDVPFAKSLDVTASARIADYSTAGVGKLWAWKLGVNWEPVDGLRFRVTKSRDIRAPSIYQLYSEGQFVTNTVSLGGVTYAQFPQNFTAGNPNLEAEIGKTLTVGAVLEPKFFPGFRASVDYFDIKVDNAIGSLNSVTVATLCDAGQQAFCALFVKDATGTPVALITGPGNLASQEVEGLEFNVNFERNLSDMFDGGPDATLSLGASGSYIFHSIVDTGAVGAKPVDRAEENSQQNGGAQPRMRVDFYQSLTFDKLTATLKERYISKGNIDNLFNTLPSNTTNMNTIPKVIYVDLYGTYRVNDKLSVFAAVDNLFDKAPPVAPYPNFIVPAVAGFYYDKVQRAYRMGITYDF